MTPRGIMWNHLYVCGTLAVLWLAATAVALLLLDPRPVARVEAAELVAVDADTLYIAAAGVRLCACPLTVARRFVHESGQVVALADIADRRFRGPGRFEATADDPIAIALPPAVRDTPGRWTYEATLNYRRNPLKTVPIEQPPVVFEVPSR